jgi:predicted dehydrogenase
MIKIAVIGYGYWGPNFVRNFDSIDNSEVAAICDLNKKNLDSARKKYPDILITNNYDELLANKEIDAVIVATPPETHFELAKKALISGKHVLVEKPLCTKASEADELIEISKNNKKVLMVDHTFQYSPAIDRLKEIISSGEIGKIQYIHSQRLNMGLFNTKGVLWDLAPHDISIILHLLDKFPEKINARAYAHIKNDIHDLAFINMHFKDVDAHIHLSWLDPCKTRKMVIVGSKKMIVYNDIDTVERIKVYDKSVLHKESYDSFGEFFLTYNYGDIHIPIISNEEPLKLACTHFLDCIENNKKPLSDGENGKAVVKIIGAIEESIKQNGADIKPS